MGVPSEPARPRRRERFLGTVVLVVGLGLTILGSALTGPTFDEERRVAAVHHATDLARAFSQFGPNTMVSSSARGVYDDLAPFGVFPGLLSGWLGEVLRSAHLIDPLTATRFGFLLVTGLAPFAVYVLGTASRGRAVGLLAAALLVGMPRFMHAASVAREPAIVASSWLCLLAAHVSSLPPTARERRDGESRSFRVAQALFAVVLGLAVATDLATLWILPLIVLHHFWTHRDTLRATLARGRAPLPSSFLLAVVISPGVLLLAEPSLWRGGAVAAADWLFAPLVPTIDPVLYRVPIATLKDVPGGYAAHFLAATTPLVILLLAGLGAGVFVRDAVAARRGLRERDRVALGTLCLLVVAGVLIGPFVTPRVFVRFPPRTETALPFLALAAAVALEFLATRVVGKRRAPWAVAGSAILAAGLGFLGVSTGSAAFNVLARGPRGAIESGIWTVGDGSEVASLSHAIDGLGQRSISAPAGDVPRTYWLMLSEVGRMRTQVDSRGSSSFSVVRGARSSPLGTVERDGAVLWTLSRR